MRLSRNRKASAIYPLLIALAGMLALALCWYILLDKSASFETKVGENQFKLIQQYQEGENYLFYMDQAAGYSADEAIARLAAGGGYVAGSGCGEIGGYELWLSSGKECYPTPADLRVSFEEVFNQGMNDYSHLSYLPESNITHYTLDYSDEKNLSFIAKPEKYTDFITKIMGKTAELPPNAVSSSLGKGKIEVKYTELGEVINYEELSRKWVN
jgi:hypothetical protein